MDEADKNKNNKDISPFVEVNSKSAQTGLTTPRILPPRRFLLIFSRQKLLENKLWNLLFSENGGK